MDYHLLTYFKELTSFVLYELIALQQVNVKTEHTERVRLITGKITVHPSFLTLVVIME